MTARKPLVVKSGVLNELVGTDVLAVYNFEHASTSLYTGGGLSINVDNTKINVAALTAVFMDYTDPQNPVATPQSFGPFIGVTLSGLATFPSTYVGIDITGTLIQQSTVFTPAQRRTILPLGLAIHSNNINVNVVNNVSAPNWSLLNQFQDLVQAVGPLNTNGNNYLANGANLNLNKTAGTIFKYGANFANDPNSPHELSIPAQTAFTFRYRQANSVEGADTTVVNPTQWDNAGVLTNVGNGNFSIQRIFLFQSGLTRIQYGQAIYNSLANALAAINTEAFTVEANIAANGIAMGVLVVKGDTTNLTDATRVRFIMASKFGAAVAAGASALAFTDIVNALGFIPVNQAGDTLTGALNWAATVSIAAAATTNIATAASNTVTVTGNTTITALGTETAGATRWVTFTGTPLLTHNATSLILPTGANIQAAAGDTATFQSLGGGNWRCTSYTRAGVVTVTLAGTETLTNKTLVNPTITNFSFTQNVPAAGSNFTVDLSLGTLHKFTTNNNTNVALPASSAGKRYQVLIVYGGVHTLSWSGGSTLKWNGGIAPTATSVAGKIDIFEFIADGTNTYGRALGSNY